MTLQDQDSAVEDDGNRYATEAKQSYREQVWDYLLDGAPPNPRCLILSGSRGYEVPLLLGRGVHEHDIVMVDESAAKVATAKKLNNVPNAKAYGCRLSEIRSRLESKSVNRANLDFCSNVLGLAEELASFLGSGILAARSRICVTFLKGRESKSYQFVIKRMGGDRVGYIQSIIEEAGFHVLGCKDGTYTNGSSPMGWVCFDLIYVRLNERNCRRVNYAISRYFQNTIDPTLRNFCARAHPRAYDYAAAYIARNLNRCRKAVYRYIEDNPFRRYDSKCLCAGVSQHVSKCESELWLRAIDGEDMIAQVGKLMRFVDRYDSMITDKNKGRVAHWKYEVESLTDYAKEFNHPQIMSIFSAAIRSGAARLSRDLRRLAFPHLYKDLVSFADSMAEHYDRTIGGSCGGISAYPQGLDSAMDFQAKL